MEIKTVEFEENKWAFLEVPWIINQDDNNWIPPLNQEVERIFDPDQNPLFKLGEARRWVLYDGSRLLGRIAAFDHPKYLSSKSPRSGGIGFFDCVNDQKAANQLFDTAIDWLKQRGVSYIEGPINFGEKDRFWGLLTEGFHEPAYGMNYNPTYYRDLFENYGFKPHYHQYTYERPLTKELSPAYQEQVKEVQRNPNYEFHPIDSQNLETYAKHFQHIYNRGWEYQKGLHFITEKQALEIFRSLDPVLIPDLIWFGYYRGTPVAFFIMVPDLNQIFKYFRGRFGWWERLKLRYHQWRGTARKTFGLTVGVDADHQEQGVEGALMLAAKSHMQKLDRWDTIEMTWIGDFNPRMISLVESLGAEHVKTHITYYLPLSA